MIVLVREDDEVHLHTTQTMTEYSSCVSGDTIVLENYIVVWK
jgi:hypothetical protein